MKLKLVIDSFWAEFFSLGETGSAAGGRVSQGSGQLCPQNVTMAGCPALSLFVGA